MGARRVERSTPSQPARATEHQRPAAGLSPLDPGGVMDLQRRAGNAAVTDLIAGRVSFPGSPPVQRKSGRTARKPKPRSRKPKPADDREAAEPGGADTFPVQRVPEPADPAVQQFLEDHRGVIGNAEFRLVEALPDDHRQAVLAELTRRYGSEYVRRGRAGILPAALPVDGTAETPEPDPLGADDYWAKYGRRHADEALARTMSSLEFTISGPGLSLPDSERSAFVYYALVGRLQFLAAAEMSQLLDADLPELVNGVRITDELGRGPDAFEPAVTQQLVDRLATGLRRATDRLALPYALARAKVIADSRSQRPAGPPDGAVMPQIDPDEAARTQPAADAFGAATTIERAVAEALTSGLFVTFDEASFSMVYVPQLSGGPRPTTLELERGAGDWKRVRVLTPADATAADVANALYGSTEFAHLVAGAGDHYAFSFPPGRQLAEPYDSEWNDHLEIDEGASQLDLIRGRVPSDPVLGLDGEAADRRALDTAANRAADGDQADVVQRLEIIQAHLTAISTAAGPLGVADQIEPLRLRVGERLTACVADPGEAQKWSAHSAAQLVTMSEAKNGFDAITQQLVAAGLPAVSTEDGDRLVGYAGGSMVGPTTELTRAFATVVAAGDQLDLAGERLIVAKQRLAAYPFDMADRMLASIRKRIAASYDEATVSAQSYGTARLDALQAEISAQVADFRAAMINGDGTAASRLGELKSQLAMLDLQTTIGSTISLIQDLSGTLPRAESMSPDKDREAVIVNELRAAMDPWRVLAGDYDELWQAGKERDEQTIVDIRRRVEALRKDSPLPDLIKQVASFTEDEAEHQRMIAIGIMIAAALLAAVTGGWASGAIGGLAGSIVGAGLEALTFTAITGTLEADQTFGGFMAELGINFATFGGLRAISGTAKLLAGGRFTLIGKAAEEVKLTLGQKAAELTVEGLFMVAATKATEEIQARLHSGEKMTTQTAATIFGHQMLIAFAGRVIGRASALFPKLPKLTGLDEVGRFKDLQLNAEKLAREFLTSGDDKAGAALVRADTEVLRAAAEARAKANEIAENPALAAKYGIGEAERAELAAGARSAARELTEREINLLMERAETSADHVIAEPEVYDELLTRHRQQGSTITESLDKAGNPEARIVPQAADGSVGKPFTLHSRLGREVEKILRRRSLKAARDVLHDYLVKRSGDRAGALAELGQVRSQAELDALLQKTVGRIGPTEITAGADIAEEQGGERTEAEQDAVRQVRKERKTVESAEKREDFRKKREAHPDWPVVDGKPVKPYVSTSTRYYWEHTQGNFIDATLSSDGTLAITVKAHGPKRVGGSDLLDYVFAHFGADNIKHFQAEWVKGTGFETNYNKYLELRAEGKSPEKAAMGTWTGEEMEKRGLRSVFVPPHALDPEVVEPVFSR